jgi:hypothetical protein
MGRLILVIVMAAVPAAAFAQTPTLRADAIICESEAPLQLLEWPNLKDQPGSIVIKRLKATIELEQLLAETNGILLNDATQEQAIRNAANINGDTSAQANRAAAAQQAARSKGAQAKSFLTHCTATGSDPAHVTIIKRLPISRRVELTMVVNGTEAEVWTTGYYLQ